MSDLVSKFGISIEQIDAYEFRVKFDKENHAELLLDEPPPLGNDAAPNAPRLLAAAVGNCLSASFVFACRKQGVAVNKMSARVNVEIVRNESRRLRVGRIEVTLDPRFAPADLEKVKAAAQVFQEFCTVSASVRQGIPIEAKVLGLAV